jgi:S1-C subfamily serine protease
VVKNVVPESAAARAGLALGDAIVAAGGQPLGAGYDLVGLLDEWNVAEPFPVELVRAGRRLRQDVRLSPA